MRRKSATVANPNNAASAHSTYQCVICKKLKTLTIKATGLARNTRAILDTVVSRGETVTIERNHILIAQMAPPERTMTASQALAGFARPDHLTPKQAAAWLEDSRDHFDDAVRDPWLWFSTAVGQQSMMDKLQSCTDYCSQVSLPAPSHAQR